MRTLAIETSCDDTSLAVISDESGFFVVEKIMAYTQTEEHKKRGGVVPELAARAHADKILTVLESLHIDRSTIDTISVTAFPGLPGALVVGVTTAYTLGSLYNKPVVQVNHIMGHVFSILVERSLDTLQLPYVCLTVSGGHNDLYVVDEVKEVKEVKEIGIAHKHNHLAIGESLTIGQYSVTKLGQTIDDAAGECFDKVARMLGGPYPGGKWIGEQASEWKIDKGKLTMDDGQGTKNDGQGTINDGQLVVKQKYVLNAAKLPDQPFNFSFSGIKGQIHQHIEQGKIDPTDEHERITVAYLFEQEVTGVLVEKLAKAVLQYGAKTIGVVGGVSANLRLREKIAAHPLLSKANVLFPTQFVYCTDNAAMIGVVGLMEAVVADTIRH